MSGKKSTEETLKGTHKGKKRKKNQSSSEAEEISDLEKTLETEYEREVAVNARFFRTEKHIKQNSGASSLSKKINSLERNRVLNIENYSSRAVVIALSKELCNLEKFPTVTLQLGNTKVDCDGGSQYWQKGNVTLRIDSETGNPIKYSDIFMKINAIVGGIFYPASNIKYNPIFTSTFVSKLLPLLKEKARKLVSFKQDEISYLLYNVTVSNQNKNQNDLLQLLNSVLILSFIIEPARRLYRKKTGEISDYPCDSKKQKKNTANEKKAKNLDKFPVALSLCKTLDFLACNQSYFSGFFYSNDSRRFSIDRPPGINASAGSNLVNCFDNKVKYTHDELSKWKINSRKSSDQEEDEILSAKEMRIMLGELFGGDSEESEGSDYSELTP